MKRFSALLIAALASLGLAFASTGASAQKQEAPKDTKKVEAPKEAKPAAKGELMDINSASEKELASLPGIGEARAKAIVKNRPYKGKNELKDRKIIPASVYDKIQDKVIARQK